MRNKKDDRSKNITYYAKILIVVALTFIIYGAVLDLKNTTRLYDPIKDVEQEETGTINITTTDGTEVVPGNTTKTTENSADTIKNNPTEVPNNIGNTIPSNSNSTNTQANQNNIPTLEETNNNLRNQIQNTYGVKILYGSETTGYTVSGIATTPITDATMINSSLTDLNDAMSLYPRAMWREIKNGGIPLTIILLYKYAIDGVTGVTDSNYYYANISIATMYSFDESFYHESYHYIERYMFKKGANYNTWDSLNPEEFTYGYINNELSYTTHLAHDAYFVNNYAQTSPEEDRASTFEYMMAKSKASCLNNGEHVWVKANVIKNTIEAVYDSVSPNKIEYWERYV